MDTFQNAGEGAESYMDDAGQTTDNFENTENTETQTETEGNEGEGEGTQENQFKPPSEAEWKKIQKEQRQTQRRFNKRTAEMHAALQERDALKKRIEELEKASTSKADDRPNIDQFESYDEYNEAVARWAARQENMPKDAPQNEQGQQQRVPPQEAQWHSQMETQAVNQAQQLAQHIPDFAETWNEAGEFFDVMPYEVEKAFYQSEHPALALYVLQKEGRLFDLLVKTPQEVAYEIGRATHMGVSSIQQYAGKQGTKQPVTQQPNQQFQQKPTGAPAPLQPNRGAGAGVKSEDRMSGRELLKKYVRE